MNLFRNFWAWLNDPRCKGTGVCVNDWLTDQEKEEFKREPESAPFEPWLRLAQSRKYAEQEARNAVWGIGLCILFFGLVCLLKLLFQ